MDEEYKMGDAVLSRTTQEKDLGVTLSADMNVSEQCGIAVSKGNQIIGLIRRTITYKEKQKSLITMWFDNNRDQETNRRPNINV